MLVRRLVLVFSIVFCGSLALAVAAVAAGGGLAPGQYTFTSHSASALFGGKGGPPQPTFSIFVNQGLNSFEPEDGSGPGNVMQSTMVLFQEFDPNGTGGFGCFVIPDGDFTVSGGLQAAALHTTLTAANQCPGFGTPVGGAPQAAPFAGGKGGGLVLPIKVDVTWKGAGVVATSTTDFTFTCLDRQEQGSNTFRDSAGGSASGTIGATGGLNTNAADVTSQDGELEIQGTIQSACFGK
jgi:hypothetical protein